MTKNSFNTFLNIFIEEPSRVISYKSEKANIFFNFIKKYYK